MGIFICFTLEKRPSYGSEKRPVRENEEDILKYIGQGLHVFIALWHGRIGVTKEVT